MEYKIVDNQVRLVLGLVLERDGFYLTENEVRELISLLQKSLFDLRKVGDKK